ncbi:MAG: putative DNA-binding domain-containing protein [Polyangiaceae bacterium]|nr:putative DNA-binding domain-containing protein [Polyangiaceae bacterium]
MAELAEDAELSRLQEWLGRALRQRRALDADPDAIAWAEGALEPSPTLSAIACAEIYRQQFWLRHTASLVDDFPGVGGVLGQARWQRLVEEYLDAHPPDSWTLRDLGHALPAFVATRDWLDDRALVADLARLEWALIEAFDAADSPPLDASAIERLDPEAWPQVRVLLDPSVRLLAACAPVHELRRGILAGEAPRALPESSPSWLVVARSPLRRLRAEPVSEAEHRVLLAQQGGAPLLGAFGEELEAGRVPPADAEATLAAWLGRWAEAGWIGAFERGG